MKKAPTSMPFLRQTSTAGYAFSMVCPFLTLRSIWLLPDSMPIFTRTQPARRIRSIDRSLTTPTVISQPHLSPGHSVSIRPHSRSI